MSEARRIADQLRRALHGPAWHGDSLEEILEGVTAEQAATVPATGVNSIHTLVLHLAAWAEIALERVQSGKTREVFRVEDFPPLGAWAVDRQRLFDSTSRLAAHIDAMSETDLNFVLEPNTQSVYVLLHGIVQHHLYHAGQIVLLKKLTRP